MSMHPSEEPNTNGTELDRQQIRRAIREMSNEYIFYLLDDAISLLSQSQLRQLIAPYLHPEHFVTHRAVHPILLDEVLEFERASLAGKYYDDSPLARTNACENSRGTVAWIAHYRRLLERCAAGSYTEDSDDVCRAFGILFALLDSLDGGGGEEIVFAEEGGSWMIGIDWMKVLPAWFRVLAIKVDSAEYTRRVERIINRHCHGHEEEELLGLARSIKGSVQ